MTGHSRQQLQVSGASVKRAAIGQAYSVITIIRSHPGFARRQGMLLEKGQRLNSGCCQRMDRTYLWNDPRSATAGLRPSQLHSQDPEKQQ